VIFVIFDITKKFPSAFRRKTLEIKIKDGTHPSKGQGK
jgi:hypothetical protein